MTQGGKRLVGAATCFLLVGVGVVGLTPTAQADTSSPDEISFAFGNSSDVGDMIASAVDYSGKAAVANALDKLSDAAASGKDVNFPGFADDRPSDQARDLGEIVQAVQSGEPLPESIADESLSQDSGNLPPAPADKERTVSTGRKVIKLQTASTTAASSPNPSASNWADFPQVGRKVTNTSWNIDNYFSEVTCSMTSGFCETRAMKHLLSRIYPKNVSIVLTYLITETGASGEIGAPFVAWRGMFNRSIYSSAGDQQVSGTSDSQTVEDQQPIYKSGTYVVASHQYALTDKAGYAKDDGRTGTDRCKAAGCAFD